jgi:hypothetical protein
LLVSSIGGEERELDKNDNWYLYGSQPQIGALYYIYQVRDDKVFEDLDILNHDENQDRLIITYEFNSNTAVDNWNEYKEILREMVGSLEYVGD